MAARSGEARVADALHALGLNDTIRPVPQGAHSAADAAGALGCSIGAIVKSLVFRTVEDETPLLVLASGAHRVDEARLAALVGAPVERAPVAFVRERTGFAVGGVPPVGHLEPLPAYFDAALLDFPVVWAAAGSPHAVFSADPEDLARVTGALIAPLGDGG